MTLLTRFTLASALAACTISGATIVHNSGVLGTIPLSGSGGMNTFQIAGQNQFTWAAPQFDPNLGTLIRTTGRVTLALTGDITVQNPNVPGQPGSDPMVLGLRIYAAPYFMVEQGGSFVAPFDLSDYSSNGVYGYVVDFDPSGVQFLEYTSLSPVAAGTTQTLSVPPAIRNFQAELSNSSGLWCFWCFPPTLPHPFIGLGTVNVQVANLKSFLQLGPASSFFFGPNASFAGNFAISMEITHEYTPNASAVPEPGTWMLLSSAGLILGLKRRFKR